MARRVLTAWLVLAGMLALPLRAEPPLNPLRDATLRLAPARFEPSRPAPLRNSERPLFAAPLPGSVQPITFAQEPALVEGDAAPLVESHLSDVDDAPVDPLASDPVELEPLAPAKPLPIYSPPQESPPATPGMIPAETWPGGKSVAPPMPLEGPPPRRFGIGQPLIGTSWRNRPLYVSIFAGGLIGDDLQGDIVQQGGGFMAGARFGGDLSNYWGLETRLAFSDLNVTYPGHINSNNSSDSYFDVSALYYPWGDTRWRPYLTVGLGIANFRYNDVVGTKISASAVSMPWGGGVKYMLNPNFALRFDMIDNLSFQSGSQLDTMNSFSFTGGVEIRFGGRRTSYGSW